MPGLTDYRAILHAHAEDSAHTGGTRPEMLAEAKREGVHAILLTDHFRPPRDFVTDSWRGLREGVLFVPGSESHGFLIYPTRSIMDRMKAPRPEFIEAVREGGGLIFLSHIEERPDHPMTGLDGMEIYNRHADAKRDAAGIRTLMLKLTEPESLAELEESLRLYPDELFAAQVEYPADYLAKWDAETQARRLTGVAANDCHHNNVLLVKMVDAETVKVGTNVDADDKMHPVPASLRKGIRELTRGHKPGDLLARLDLDPYSRSFRNVSTHVLAPELDEEAIRAALRAGHAYVSHDWMCDPSGFRFELISTPADGNRASRPDGRRGDLRPGGEAGGAIPRLVPHPPRERREGDRRAGRRSPGTRRPGARRVPRRGLAHAGRRDPRMDLLEPHLRAPGRRGGSPRATAALTVTPDACSGEPGKYSGRRGRRSSGKSRLSGTGSRRRGVRRWTASSPHGSWRCGR